MKDYFAVEKEFILYLGFQGPGKLEVHLSLIHSQQWIIFLSLIERKYI